MAGSEGGQDADWVASVKHDGRQVPNKESETMEGIGGAGTDTRWKGL